MGYSIEAIKAKLAAKDQSTGSTTGDTDGRIRFFKPSLGPNNTPKEYDIRFAPYEDSMGQPIQTVAYYSKLQDGMDRFVVPTQFGLPDPVKAVFEKMRKTKEGWQIAKLLKPMDKAAAQVLDRSEEAKGWQLWEFNTDLRDDIYAVLVHKDNIDEQLFSPETGYDFTLTVSHKIGKDGKPSFFNGYPVKDYKLVQRKRSSKLMKDEKGTKKLLSEIVNLEEYYKGKVKSPEDLQEALEAFMQKLQGEEPASTTALSPTNTVPGTHTGETANTGLSAMFADL